MRRLSVHTVFGRGSITIDQRFVTYSLPVQLRSVSIRVLHNLLNMLRHYAEKIVDHCITIENDKVKIRINLVPNRWFPPLSEQLKLVLSDFLVRPDGKYNLEDRIERIELGDDGVVEVRFTTYFDVGRWCLTAWLYGPWDIIDALVDRSAKYWTTLKYCREGDEIATVYRTFEDSVSLDDAIKDTVEKIRNDVGAILRGFAKTFYE